MPAKLRKGLDGKPPAHSQHTLVVEDLNRGISELKKTYSTNLA